MNRGVAGFGVLVGAVVLAAGVFVFMNGYHNTDLAFNFRTIEKAYNTTILENAGWFFSPEVAKISVNELYALGMAGMGLGAALIFLGSVLLGFSLRAVME
jgi:hypothetical protein